MYLFTDIISYEFINIMFLESHHTKTRWLFDRVAVYSEMSAKKSCVQTLGAVSWFLKHGYQSIHHLTAF